MPIPLVIGALLAVAGFLVYSGVASGDSSDNASTDSTNGSSSMFTGITNLFTQPVSFPTTNSLGLPDCDPSDQGGKFSTAYDDAFLTACQKWGVPFAWLKAQAIRESSLNPNAHATEPNPPGSYSYGLAQIHWWAGSNRLAKFGYPDDLLGDGSMLFNPIVNADLEAQFLLANFKQYGTVRDAINAYNTGKSEAKHEAPGGYVDKIVGYYSQIAGTVVS